MASWIKIHETLNDSLAGICTDRSGKFYYYKDDEEIYEYDADTDTETKISDIDTSWSPYTDPVISLQNRSLCFFQGSPYTIIVDSSADDQMSVFKWSGSGTSWTQVLAFNPGILPASTLRCQLNLSENHLILVDSGIDITGGTTNPPTYVDLKYTVTGQIK